MKSNLVSASVLAIAALATFGSASSFAESNPFPQDNVRSVSTKSRAEVRAELVQAQREGYNVNLGNTYQDVKAAPASANTRAQVQREAGGAVSVSADERSYPVMQ